MKLKLQLIILLFLSIYTSAQNEKGKFFIETGVKVFGGGDFLNFIGKTGFSYNETKWATYKDDGSLWQEDSYNNFSWAIAPRLGYSLSKLIKAGIDFQYHQNIASYGVKYRNFTSGLFFRLHFNDRRIKPFIELSSGLGLSKQVEESRSPGGAEYLSIENLKLLYYSGSAGLTFVLSSNFNLNLSARMQNTLENEVKNKDKWSVSYITEKRHNFEIGPMLSFTYIFRNKKENQK